MMLLLRDSAMATSVTAPSSPFSSPPSTLPLPPQPTSTISDVKISYFPLPSIHGPRYLYISPYAVTVDLSSATVAAAPSLLRDSDFPPCAPTTVLLQESTTTENKTKVSAIVSAVSNSDVGLELFLSTEPLSKTQPMAFSDVGTLCRNHRLPQSESKYLFSPPKNIPISGEKSEGCFPIPAFCCYALVLPPCMQMGCFAIILRVFPGRTIFIWPKEPPDIPLTQSSLSKNPISLHKDPILQLPSTNLTRILPPEKGQLDWRLNFVRGSLPASIWNLCDRLVSYRVHGNDFCRSLLDLVLPDASSKILVVIDLGLNGFSGMFSEFVIVFHGFKHLDPGDYTLSNLIPGGLDRLHLEKLSLSHKIFTGFLLKIGKSMFGVEDFEGNNAAFCGPPWRACGSMFGLSFGAIAGLIHAATWITVPYPFQWGASVMLELTRMISQWAQGFKNGVIFLFNTGEEEGLNGAHNFINQHPWSDTVGVAVDLESNGVVEGILCNVFFERNFASLDWCDWLIQIVQIRHLSFNSIFGDNSFLRMHPR